MCLALSKGRVTDGHGGKGTGVMHANMNSVPFIFLPFLFCLSKPFQVLCKASVLKEIHKEPIRRWFHFPTISNNKQPTNY